MLKLIKGLTPYLLLGALTLFSSCSSDDTELLTRGGIFQTPSGDATIEGELFLPEGTGPFPSMIIIVGSSNESRQTLEGFATILNSNGYALYLYDKRGVGNSTGSYPSDITELISARADDVLGIIELLNSHSKIDNQRIGIYGGSQGAWVNSVVFERYSNLAYIVMASGGVASTGIEGHYCALTDDPNVSIDEATAALESFSGDTGFDPRPIIETMQIPVLWIYGNEDRSHPARYDVAVLATLNKSNFTVLVYDNTNHELIDLTTQQPPTTYISDLGQWLQQHN